MAAYTTFELVPAPHAGNRLMVQAVRFEHGLVMSDETLAHGDKAASGWFERFGLLAHSPTGVLDVIHHLRSNTRVLRGENP